MMEIEMPKIEIEENEDRSYAKVIVEPLEKGFGITLGNCLRRTLLSSLPGAAAQGIKFNVGNVMHEFSTINGVKEDVTDIILNLKNVAIKTASLDQNYKRVVRLYKEGPCVVTAGDIAQDAEITILNPNAYICTVDSGACIDMDITIGRDTGYKGADFNKTDEIGYIAIDSIYSPVKKASYTVESTRVNQADKLILEVWTNGTTSGREVVSLAAKIIEDHIHLFVTLTDAMSGLDIL